MQACRKNSRHSGLHPPPLAFKGRHGVVLMKQHVFFIQSSVMHDDTGSHSQM
jgi:hypothetical protein